MNEKYYPNLRGKVDPAVEESIRVMYEHLHSLRDTKANIADVATRVELTKRTSDVIQQVTEQLQNVPGYELLVAGNSSSVKRGQGSVLPTVSGALTYANGGNNIDWSWSGKKQRWPNKDIDPIPDGTVPSSGLALSTTYTFYPRYSIDRGQYELAAVNGGVGSNGVAYLTRNDDATQAQALDGYAALSIGGMQAATTGGGGGAGGSGGGSGCIHEQMVAEDENGKLVRFGSLKRGSIIMGPTGQNVVTFVRAIYESAWIELYPSLKNEHPWVTMMHPLCWKDTTKHAVAFSCQDLLIGRDDQYVQCHGTRLHHSARKERAIAIECEPDHMYFFGENSACLLSHNIPVGK